MAKPPTVEHDTFPPLLVPVTLMTPFSVHVASRVLSIRAAAALCRCLCFCFLFSYQHHQPQRKKRFLARSFLIGQFFYVFFFHWWRILVGMCRLPGSEKGGHEMSSRIGTLIHVAVYHIAMCFLAATHQYCPFDAFFLFPCFVVFVFRFFLLPIVCR